MIFFMMIKKIFEWNMHGILIVDIHGNVRGCNGRIINGLPLCEGSSHG
jgi:hypothetical protein